MVGYRLTTVCDTCGWAEEHNDDRIQRCSNLTMWFDGSWEVNYSFRCSNCNKRKDINLGGQPCLENEYFNRPSCVGGK